MALFDYWVLQLYQTQLFEGNLDQLTTPVFMVYISAWFQSALLLIETYPQQNGAFG